MIYVIIFFIFIFFPPWAYCYIIFRCGRCIRIPATRPYEIRIYGFSFRVQKIRQSVFAFIYVAHSAFCVFIQYRSELRMRVVKTLEYWQQSADDCLRIFVHGDMKLPSRVSHTHTRMNVSAGLSDACA